MSTATSSKTTVKHTYDAPTAKQLAYAESLARKAGFRNIAAARRAKCGKNPIGDIRREACSELIDWLQDRVS